MATDPSRENPYAPSTLYEPSVPRAIVLLPHDIVARGTITQAHRRHAFLLAYRVRNRDLIEMWKPALMLSFLCFGVISNGVSYPGPIAVLLLLFVLSASYLCWQRLRVERWAREEHETLGGLTLERTITDQGIITRHAAEQELTPWTAYKLCRIDRDLLLMARVQPRSFQVFPRHHFASQQDWVLFQSAVQHFVRQV